MKRIAITGGVAVGKSTVLGYLRELGRKVDSADRLAREVFDGPEVQASISRLLSIPTPVLPQDVRARLTDATARRQINSITHPHIVRALRATEAEFIEVPLLIETCLQGEFDRVWVVTCDREEQLRRLSARWGETAAEAMIRTQLTSRTKIPFADCIIRTNREETSVKRCVTLAVQRDLR